MAENIYLYAFATFGHPNDFRQTCFLPTKRGTELNIKLFDLTNSIKVYPNSELYAIRKEIANGMKIISYSKYTFAKEKLSERDGTFIGSSILYTKSIANENITLKKLNHIHNELIKKNIVEERLTVTHSKDFLLAKTVVSDFDKISLELKIIDKSIDFSVSNDNLVVYSRLEESNLQQKLKKSLELLSKFDTLFFTDDKNIVDFTKSRGIYKVVTEADFDKEIEKIHIERKQKITDAIAKFEKNKLQLEEEKNREIENRKKQIEQNQQKQSENQKKIEESKSDLSKLENLYKTFAGHISILMSNLHSGKTLDEVNNSYKQFEKEFNDEKRKLSSTNHVSSVSNPRSTSQVSPFSNPYEKPNYGNYNDGDDGKNNFSKILTIISLVLNVLLIGGIIYLYFINSDTKKKLENAENIATSKEVIESNESDPVLVESKLNPIPNDVAKNKIEEIQNKLIDNSTKIDEVVKIVFEINKPIRDAYKYQKGDYEEYLIKENPSAFNSNKILINKDSLKKIPFYKDENLKTESVNNTTSTK
ncbi:hypothetical protein [Chryseobacterium sp.]|uniref:hypothetical protein n=1 Tax=Chryseobacterium sp. TaxID=1871047 RepID=UPI002FCAEE6C